MNQLKFKRINILFLFNSQPNTELIQLISKYKRPHATYHYAEKLDNISDYDLIIPWNYHKKITNIDNLKNVIVFHASDLPKGRGWAPIANTILNNEAKFVITGIIANNEIDKGPIVLKASMDMRPYFTASILRNIDNELISYLTAELSELCALGELKSVPQNEKNATYQNRRISSDLELQLHNKLKDCIPLLRSAEREHPCYLLVGDIKYEISIKPVIANDLKLDINLTFPGYDKYTVLQLILSESKLSILEKNEFHED